MSRPMDWKGAVGLEWAYKHRMYDRLMAPMGTVALDALGDVSGKRVLDVGCGAGHTTLELSARGAFPTGVDISEAQIDVARAQDPNRRCAFVTGDAGEVEYVRRFDALYSRGATNYFMKPVQTFRHLRAYARAGAPMSMVFFKTAAENDWSEISSGVASSVLGRDTSTSRDGPHGPFAWADEEIFRKVLRESGWRNTRSEIIHPMMRLSDPKSDDPVGSAVEACAAIILRRRLGGCTDDQRKKVLTSLHKEFSKHVVDGSVQLGCTAWLVQTTA